MTISSDVRKAGPFAGNGTTTSFPFAFLVFSEDDVVVVFTDADSVESTLALGTGYTVTLNADQNASPGGTVDLPAALATGAKLTLTSSVAALQPTDLTNQGGFYPKVITAALDRLTILVQQISEKTGRALVTPISSDQSGKDYLDWLIGVLGADSAAAAVAAVGVNLSDFSDRIGSIEGSALFLNWRGDWTPNTEYVFTPGVRRDWYRRASDGKAFLVLVTHTSDSTTQANDVAAGWVAENDAAQAMIQSAGVAASTIGRDADIEQTPGRSELVLNWGQDCLHEIQRYVYVGAPVRIAIIGDSNSAGYVGAELKTLLNKLPVPVTIDDYAVGGTTSEIFRNDPAMLETAVAADVYQLIIFGYGGTNDPLYGRTVEQFAEHTEYCIAQLRTKHIVGSTSILMMTANSARDATLNTFVKDCARYVKKTARAHQCALFDKHGRRPDGQQDLAGTGIGTVFDSYGLHTQDFVSKLVAQEIFDFLFPARMLGDQVVNRAAVRSVTDAPSDYPLGISLYVGTGGGWPSDVCIVHTAKIYGSGNSIQTVYDFTTDKTRVWMRSTFYGAWNSFKELSAEKQVSAATLAAGFSAGDPPISGHKNAGFLCVSGGVAVNSPAVLPAETLIATLPAGFRPFESIHRMPIITVYNGPDPALASSFEVVHGRILANGEIRTAAATVGAATVVYVNVTVPSA